MGLQQLRLRIAPFTTRPSAPIWPSLVSSIRFFRPRLSRPSIRSLILVPGSILQSPPFFLVIPRSFFSSSLRIRSWALASFIPCYHPWFQLPHSLWGSHLGSSAALPRLLFFLLLFLLPFPDLRPLPGETTLQHVPSPARPGFLGCSSHVLHRANRMALCEQTICVAVLTRGIESGKHVERGDLNAKGMRTGVSCFAREGYGTPMRRAQGRTDGTGGGVRCVWTRVRLERVFPSSPTR